MTAQAVLLDLIDKARTKCKRQYKGCQDRKLDYEEFSLRMRDLEVAEGAVEEHFKLKEDIF